MIPFLLAAAALVCAPPEPAAPPDPIAAQAYFEVGEQELANGAGEAALFAFREAARLDASNERARAAFVAVCTTQQRGVLLASGRDKLDAGDTRGAIETFRALAGDPEAALYEGIARYEQGDDDEARPLFAAAMTAPAFESRARYFLGLIELRGRSGNDAARLFEQVAASGEPLADRALVLRGAALRSGRAVVSAALESGYDSNVSFTPDTLPATGDFGGGASLSLSLRPLGLSGPYLHATGFYRRQAQATDRDFGSFAMQGGYRLGRGETHAFADYAYEQTLLGGAPLLQAHRVRAGGRWQVRRFGLSLLAAARFGTYQTAGTSAFSGAAFTLSPEVSYRLPLGSAVSLGYLVLRDAANAADASSWEHGPRAAARVTLRPSLRLLAEAGALLRAFDAGSPQPRSDTIGFAAASVEQDLGRFTVRLGSSARRSASSDTGASYTRLTATLGVSYTLSIF